jgi:hypothetical protein
MWIDVSDRTVVRISGNATFVFRLTPKAYEC